VGKFVFLCYKYLTIPARQTVVAVASRCHVCKLLSHLQAVVTFVSRCHVRGILVICHGPVTTFLKGRADIVPFSAIGTTSWVFGM
jgi:hypothetical protein